MPVRKVGPNSYQWGTSGKVYSGKGAKAKAERQGRAIYASGYKGAESYKPPASAIANAKRGLKLRKEWGRGGLSPSEAAAQGIDSGVTRARRIASGTVSRHDVRRMSAFNRHRKNYRPDKKMSDGGPTAGTIAWLLWGGTSGVNWAKKKSATMGAETFGAEEYLTSQEIKQHIEYTHLDENGEPDYYYWNPEWDDLIFSREQIPMTLFEDWNWDDTPVSSRRLEDILIGSHMNTQYPTIVLREDDGEYDVIDGFHRLNAMHILGHELVDAYVGRNKKSLAAENWGGDPDGPLAKALAQARESLKQSRKPLQITRLPDPNQKTLKDFEADVITNHRPYPDVYGRYGWKITSKFCWKCGDLDHHYSNCKSTQKYTDALSRKKDMLKAVNAAIKLYSNNPSDVNDLKELRRMIKNNHFGIARHYFNSLDTVVRDNIGYDTEISFEADWQDLPRNKLGQWQRPVSITTLNNLIATTPGVPKLSELLNLYGGDTPNNRVRLYNDMLTLRITTEDFEDDIPTFEQSDAYAWILEEPLDVAEENPQMTPEYWDRYIRHLGMTSSQTELESRLENLMNNLDLFSDEEEQFAEISMLMAALRQQKFMEKYQAD